MFDPILAWARRELGAELQVSHSIFGASLPDSDVQAVRSYLQGELAGWLAGKEGGRMTS